MAGGRVKVAGQQLKAPFPMRVSYVAVHVYQLSRKSIDTDYFRSQSKSSWECKIIQPSLNFSTTPASITADAERLVRESKHQRDELVGNIAPDKVPFANVMLPLAQM